RTILRCGCASGLGWLMRTRCVAIDGGGRAREGGNGDGKTKGKDSTFPHGRGGACVLGASQRGGVRRKSRGSRCGDSSRAHGTDRGSSLQGRSGGSPVSRRETWRWAHHLGAISHRGMAGAFARREPSRTSSENSPAGISTGRNLSQPRRNRWVVAVRGSGVTPARNHDVLRLDRGTTGHAYRRVFRSEKRITRRSPRRRAAIHRATL